MNKSWSPGGGYHFTHSRSNQAIPVDYTKINVEAYRSDMAPSGLHPAIAESLASCFFNEGHASVYVSGTSDEIAQ